MYHRKMGALMVKVLLDETTFPAYAKSCIASCRKHATSVHAALYLAMLQDKLQRGAVTSVVV